MRKITEGKLSHDVSRAGNCELVLQKCSNCFRTPGDALTGFDNSIEIRGTRVRRRAAEKCVQMIKAPVPHRVGAASGFQGIAIGFSYDDEAAHAHFGHGLRLSSRFAPHLTVTIGESARIRSRVKAYH